MSISLVHADPEFYAPLSRTTRRGTEYTATDMPATWSEHPPNPDLRVASTVLTGLFLVAMVIAVAAPGVGYSALGLLFLMNPIMQARARRLKAEP